MSILEKYTNAIDKKDESTMNELLQEDFKFTMHKSGTDSYTHLTLPTSDLV